MRLMRTEVKIMETKEEIMRTLNLLTKEVQEKYKVRRLGLFGSVVRQEQHARSDIDLLVDFSDEADFFDLVGLSLFLEEKLGRKVDVVPEKSLRAELRESVLREVIYL